MVATTDDPPIAGRPDRFASLWTAAAASNLGDGIYQYGLPLLVVQVTSAPGAVALVSVMLTLGWPVFGLFAGSVVDHVDRRRLLLMVTAVRVLVLGTLAVLLATGSPPLLVFYLAALVLGIGETLVDTATTALVPAVVPRDRLAWANGRVLAAQTVTNSFVGPPLVGVLVGVAGWLVAAAGTVSFALTALLVSRIPGTFRVAVDPDAPRERLRDRLTEGARMLWREPILRRLTLFTAAMNVWWAVWAALFVVFAVAPGPMGLAAHEYGLLVTGMALGGLAGSVLAARLQRWLGTRTVLAVDLLGTALLLGAPAVTTHPILVGAAMVVAGAGSAVWVVIVGSLRQTLVPDRLLGRVYSASRLVSWGVLPVGAAAGGVAAEVVGVPTVFAAGAIVSVGLSVLFLATVSSAALRQAASGADASA